MSHLNIAFDRYDSIGTVMHYILVKSKPERDQTSQKGFGEETFGPKERFRVGETQG